MLTHSIALLLAASLIIMATFATATTQQREQQLESVGGLTAILNGDSFTKGVRTKDGEPIGYIAAEDEEFIYVLSSRFREYRIPKSHVMTFDGSVVLLDLEFGEVGRYKIG